MKNQKVIGGIVAGFVVAAVGGLLVWRRRNKKASTVPPVQAVPTAELEKLDAAELHRAELHRYMSDLEITEADKFFRFYNQLENKLKDDDSSDAHDQVADLGNYITFLLTLRNRAHESSKTKATLLEAAVRFPQVVYDAVEHMPEMGRKLCRSMAEGISECLLEGLEEPQRIARVH